MFNFNFDILFIYISYVLCIIIYFFKHNFESKYCNLMLVLYYHTYLVFKRVSKLCCLLYISIMNCKFNLSIHFLKDIIMDPLYIF